MRYFGIGVYSGKTEFNIGTLWRSAYQLGASFIFIINRRYKKQHSDTCKTHRHIPLLQFDNFEHFKKSLYDCPLVCVEFNEKSISLPEFSHPKTCVYLLGAEDHGIPEKIYENYPCIEIPNIRQPSYNVAVAGSIVMYDRLIKNKQKEYEYAL